MCRSYRAYFSHLMDSSCSRLHRAQQGNTRLTETMKVMIKIYKDDAYEEDDIDLTYF